MLQVRDNVSDGLEQHRFLALRTGVYDWEVECQHISQRVHGCRQINLLEAHWRILVGDDINHLACGDDAAAKCLD